MASALPRSTRTATLEGIEPADIDLPLVARLLGITPKSVRAGIGNTHPDVSPCHDAPFRCRHCRRYATSSGIAPFLQRPALRSRIAWPSLVLSLPEDATPDLPATARPLAATVTHLRVFRTLCDGAVLKA